MIKWGGGLAATAALFLSACVTTPDGTNLWDASEHRANLGAAADDPWCVYMKDLRTHLDGNGARPSDAERDAAISAVRDEATKTKGGDPYWPFRKALICEYIDGASEEREEFDWDTAAEFLAAAREAATAQPPEDGIRPLVAVFDHLDGSDPASLEPVDLTEPTYCEAIPTSELALSQQRGGVLGGAGFPGSLQRAPDWFAHVQVTYHRWAREHLEGHQITKGPVDFGGIPFHCQRFHAALAGSKEFAVKDNLIFLLAERDDPTKAGRLEIRDSQGNLIVLDQVLAAAQLEADGSDGEAIDFFADDVKASPSLASAVDRANSLPAPKVYQVFFPYNRRDADLNEQGAKDLAADLAERAPDDPIRIAMTGHADCVGPKWYNQIISEDRVRSVFDTVITPTLLAAGFSAEDLADKQRFKIKGLGEIGAEKPAQGRCAATDGDRRVTVVVQ